MSNESQKHKNYEILNLLGYGLAKFNDDFVRQFGFTTKTEFYNYFVKIGIAEREGVVKNRQDLFDPFFDNGRKGWWQKGDAYIHRKILIDNLFGKEDVVEYANIVKMYLHDNFRIKELMTEIKPIQKSRFKKMQETGLEAELFFMGNYNQIKLFNGGILEDARLYGDGYDFQIDKSEKYYLAEIKGLRDDKGNFRLTENEYNKAQEYQDNYILTLVLNLNEQPKFLTIENPLKSIPFEKRIIKGAETAIYCASV